MDLSYKPKRYEDFYVAYFNSAGNVIYPSDMEEVQIVRQLLKNSTSDSFAWTEDHKKCYKIHIKRKFLDGSPVQIVELSNVDEFIKQISKASVDDITHLNNRKLAMNLFSQYLEHAIKVNEDFALIMTDIDGFKDVNDTYGHTNGDAVLSEISRKLYCSTRQECFRAQDIVARIGGDEFFIVLKNVNKDIAYNRAEKIRKAVESHKVPLFGQEHPINYIDVGTLSIGLYHVAINEVLELYDKGYTIEEIRNTLLDRCDRELYKSKNSGKNKITIYDGETKML